MVTFFKLHSFSQSNRSRYTVSCSNDNCGIGRKSSGNMGHSDCIVSIEVASWCAIWCIQFDARALIIIWINLSTGSIRVSSINFVPCGLGDNEVNIPIITPWEIDCEPTAWWFPLCPCPISYIIARLGNCYCSHFLLCKISCCSR